VSAIDTGDGTEMSHRADERFAMCSTFKWVLAAFVLSQVDQDEISLDERLSYGPSDLLDYSPVAKEHVDAGWLTVDTLCRASVTISDNTAANLLLHRVGGPAELTSFLRQTGDTVTQLDRNEPELNSNLPGDERDTTTPRAMAGSMNRILVGDVLSARRPGHAAPVAEGRHHRSGAPPGRPPARLGRRRQDRHRRQWRRQRRRHRLATEREPHPDRRLPLRIRRLPRRPERGPRRHRQDNRHPYDLTEMGTPINSGQADGAI
jgi:beta-lactamase class A